MTSVRWWDLAVGGCLAAMAVVAALGPADSSPVDSGLVDSGLVDSGLVGALAVLATLGLTYLGLGRRSLRRLSETGRERTMPASTGAFLAVLILGAGLGAAFVPNLATLQAIAFPLVWVLAGSITVAIWLSVAVAVSAGIGLTQSLGGTAQAMVEAGAIEAISFIFAIALGSWITRIAAAGERHRRLLGDLTQAQDELAALNRAAGIAAERERLSREIHDTIAQTLTGLVLLAQRTRGELVARPAQVAAAQSTVDLIETNAREALTETRALVAALSPVREPGMNLTGTMLRLADRFTRETGIQTDATVHVGALDREVEVVLLRCVQEGLANVRQHSGAAAASILIDRTPTMVVLTVTDDGRGLGPPRADPNTGFGLAGMRDRVLLVHGEVHLGVRPTGGTTLRVTVPLSHDASPAPVYA